MNKQQNGTRPRRLLACVGHYPSPYKPYYDTQFAEFLRAGYELQIVAAPALDRTVNEKVLAAGLLERMHYYPIDGRSGGARSAAKVIANPIESARFLGRVRSPSIRRAALDLFRLHSLPRFEPDAILVHELGVALRFPWLRAWFRDKPVALYYHGGEVASIDPHEDSLVRDAFRSFDVVFTNTEFSRQHAIGRGCPADRTRILPVGFNLDDYVPPSPRRYRPDGVLRLLSAGRMSEEKGFDYALEALRLLVASGRTNVLYSFTADGYVRPKLEEFVKQHDLAPYVRFLGTLTTAEVTAAMAASDALVLSSVTVGNWAENQACAVQEAMLMKSVVVTTRTGGVPESIAPDMARFSVPERDAPALARALMAVYDLAEPELASLGERGRAYVKERYDIRKLNEQMMAVLCACP